MKIELAVRIYPGLTRTPVMAGTKLNNVTRCMTSLYHAIKDKNVHIHFILDKCPDQYEETISSIFSSLRNVTFHSVDYGNGYGTFKFQIDLLANSTADVVGFIEDDYYFEEDCFDNFAKMLPIFNQNTFYTAFNSSDYSRHRYHINNTNKVIISELRYLDVGSTTLSFFCSPNALRYYKGIFLTYTSGNSDYPMWLLITRRWRNLITFSTLFNYYDLTKVAKVLFYSRHLLKKKGRLLVATPGKAIHLEPDGFSIDHDMSCFH